MDDRKRPVEAVRHAARYAAHQIFDSLAHTSSIILRRDKCDPDPNNEGVNLCEKPVSSSFITLAVLVTIGGVCAGATLLTLMWLHFRRVARDKREIDPAELAEYGIDDEDLSAAKQMMKQRTRLIGKAQRLEKSSIGWPKPMTPDRYSFIPRDSIASLERSIRQSADPLGASPYHEDSPGFIRQDVGRLSPEPLVARNLTRSPQPMVMAESPLLSKSRLGLPSKRKPVPISKK